ADSLKVSRRCDCNPNVCQMRAIVAFESPATSAMLRVVHCVVGAGGPSSVRVITSTIRSSVALRGAPGRGSSVKPGNRRTRNRSRHLHTLLLDTRSRLATARLVRPSAQASTIRDRRASRCAEVGGGSTAPTCDVHPQSATRACDDVFLACRAAYACDSRSTRLFLRHDTRG